MVPVEGDAVAVVTGRRTRSSRRARKGHPFRGSPRAPLRVPFDRPAASSLREPHRERDQISPLPAGTS
jgi:hypothetical protein